MKNNKFLMNTFTLIIGGFVVKILSFIVKILYTRIIGVEGLSLYSLIMPSFAIMVSISGFGMPVVISKLIAGKNKKTSNILMSGIILLLILNFISVFFIIFCSDFIANSLLHDSRCKILIIGASLCMPNMGLACILKGYFYGKQKMLPNSISNVIEQLIRIIFILFFLPNIIKNNLVTGLLSYFLINILTEAASIITFLFLLPKNIKIKLDDIKINYSDISLLFFDALPLVSAKLVGNIGYFFEPIILMFGLGLVGYSNQYFMYQYGIYNGYSIALLLMPSFFIQAICTSIIPEVSKYYSNNDYKMLKKRCKQSLLFSIFIGIFFTLFIFIFRDFLLNLFYGNTLGSDYLFYLSFIFPLFYLEAPLMSILQALGYSNYSFIVSIFTMVLKLLFMFLFSLLRIGLYSLVIAEAIDIILVTSLNYFKLKIILKKLETSSN